MPRGGKRAGAGKPKGRMNYMRAMSPELIADIRDGVGALDWLKGVMLGLVTFEQIVDGKVVVLPAPPHERLDAAVALASFTCPRPLAQPMALLTHQAPVIDHDGGDPEIPEFKRPN